MKEQLRIPRVERRNNIKIKQQQQKTDVKKVHLNTPKIRSYEEEGLKTMATHPTEEERWSWERQQTT